MSNDFQPGDVGINENGETVFCIEPTRGVRNSVDVLGRRAPLGRRDHVRRLVVIDPESTVDVDRICKALVEQMHRAGDVASAANGVHPATVAAALREFAEPAPVKPPEPTGLGAVIEDTDGAKWVLVGVGDLGGVDPWKRTPPVPSRPTWLAYADINAVTVLSEGVQS